jgi:hypothetical protein
MSDWHDPDEQRLGDETEKLAQLEQLDPEETLVQESTADSPTHQRRTLGAFTQARISAQPTTTAPTALHSDETITKVRALQKAPSETTRALIADSRAGDGEKPLVISGARKPRRPARYVVPRRSGPRSFLAQFLVAMVATAMVASALTLTTPIGAMASLNTGGGPLQLLANSAPWLPTPTNTPKPKSFMPPPGANPGQQAIINEIVAVFGANAQNALIVAKCESGYDPNAWNSYPIGNSHASGVFQILYPSTWDTTSYAADSPFNASDNIYAAYQIFHRDGNNWREWQCAKIHGIV